MCSPACSKRASTAIGWGTACGRKAIPSIPTFWCRCASSCPRSSSFCGRRSALRQTIAVERSGERARRRRADALRRRVLRYLACFPFDGGQVIVSFCGSLFRESTFGFGPKVRTSKLGRTAKNRRPAKADLRFLVEATGFEPTTFWSLTKRATKLRYASMKSTSLLYRLFAVCQVIFSAFGQLFLFSCRFFGGSPHGRRERLMHTFLFAAIQWTGGT